MLSRTLRTYFIMREKLLTGIRELGIEPHNEDQGTGDLRYVQVVFCYCRYLVEFVVMLVISDLCVLVLLPDGCDDIQYIYSCLRKIPTRYGSELTSCLLSLNFQFFTFCKFFGVQIAFTIQN